MAGSFVFPASAKKAINNIVHLFDPENGKLGQAVDYVIASRRSP